MEVVYVGPDMMRRVSLEVADNMIFGSREILQRKMTHHHLSKRKKLGPFVQSEIRLRDRRGLVKWEEIKR